MAQSSNPANIPPDVIASLPPKLQAQIPRWYSTLRPNIYAVAGICTVAVYVAVPLRLYARRLKGQELGWDDYLIIVASFVHAPWLIVCVLATYWGTGLHAVVVELVHPEWRVPSIKATIAASALQGVPLLFAKLSLLFLYNRIFGTCCPRVKQICLGLGVFVTAYTVSAIIASAVSCIPISAAWDPSVASLPTTRCIDIGKALEAIACLNVVTDTLILVLPMPYIWSMTRTSLAGKLRLTGIFLLGSFVVAVSFARSSYVRKVSTARDDDSSWVNAAPLMLSISENGIATVAACLPVMRPVYNKLFYGSIEGKTESGRRCDVERRPKGMPQGTAEGTAEEDLVTDGGRMISSQSRPLVGCTSGVRTSETVSVTRDGKEVWEGDNHGHEA